MTTKILVFVALLSSATIASAHDWRASGAPAGWTSTSTTATSPGAAPYSGTRTRVATTWHNGTGAAQRIALAVFSQQCSQWSAGLDDEYYAQYPESVERIGYQMVPVYTWTVPAGGSVLTESVTESGQWYDGDSYISDSSSMSTEIVRSEAAETWSWQSYSVTGAWSDWGPDPSTVAAGQSYTQSRARSIEDRKKEISSNGAERGDQHVAWRSESESRPATGTMETWTLFDEPGAWTYGTWSPDPSTIDAGQSYTQSRTASRWHRTGERSNLGNERGVGGYTETSTESRPATGTRPIATTFSFANLSHTYDGSPKSATVTASPAAATYTFSPTGGPDAGDYVVSASATGNYTGTASATLTIAKASQTITFPAIPEKTEGDAPFTISATATSGLPVTFAVLSGPASISGATVTITGAGTAVIRASQAGNGNYSAASNVDQTFTVQPGQPTIFANIASLDMGNARVNSTPATTSVTFRITNTGYQTLQINSITFGNTDYTVIGHDGGAVSYPRNLGAGAGINITVLFNPSAIGSRNTTMMITNNTVSNPNAIYTVTGLGQDPDLVITWPGPLRLIP